MWIFLTAVFLVLFFLFYRHPKEMFKATGALVVVLGLAILGFVLWNQQTVEDQTARTVQQGALREADAARWREIWAEQERQKKQAEAEQERQKQAIAAAQARQAAAFEARREDALRKVVITTDGNCTSLLGCREYRLTVTLANRSGETISNISLGWVFVPANQSCPSTVQTRRSEQVVLRPGANTVFNFDGYDGPLIKDGVRYCVIATDVKLAE